jgi:hypothetical protein
MFNRTFVKLILGGYQKIGKIKVFDTLRVNEILKKFNT